MDDTDKRVHKYIEKHDLIRSDDKLLVAVSGGRILWRYCIFYGIQI